MDQIKKYLDIKLIKTCLVFSLAFSLMFNSSVILYKYGYYKVSFWVAVFELLKEFIYSYIAVLIFFLGLSFSRPTFIIGSLFLFITGAVSSYYLFYFGIGPTEKMMPAIYGSSMKEIQELISVKVIVWVLFSLSICVFSIKHFNPETTRSFVYRLLTFFCLFLAINNVISPQFRFLRGYFPVQYLHNSYKYLFTPKKVDHKKKVNIGKSYKFKTTHNQNDGEDIVGILVIGESARYDHLGINGYKRNTTPRLSTLDNLFSFRARSCENMTYLSIMCLLSRHNAQNISQAADETGLLSVFTELGFDTAWISTQSILKYYDQNDITPYDEVNFAIIPGGSILYNMNDYDGLMLPYIQKHLEGKGRQFLAIQLSGSHWNYAERYPDEFIQFTPVQKKYTKADHASCSYEELINSYDNSLLYTDFFLAGLIELLKDKNAFMIYVSDHGESLGENGRYGHGDESVPEQRDIPFMVWVSDNFKRNYPNLVRSINNYKGQIISHDYVFHSALHCLGIESEIVDLNYSLCGHKLK